MHTLPTSTAVLLCPAQPWMLPLQLHLTSTFFSKHRNQRKESCAILLLTHQFKSIRDLRSGSVCFALNPFFRIKWRSFARPWLYFFSSSFNSSSFAYSNTTAPLERASLFCLDTTLFITLRFFSKWTLQDRALVLSPSSPTTSPLLMLPLPATPRLIVLLPTPPTLQARDDLTAWLPPLRIVPRRSVNESLVHRRACKREQDSFQVYVPVISQNKHLAPPLLLFFHDIKSMSPSKKDWNCEGLESEKRVRWDAKTKTR